MLFLSQVDIGHLIAHSDGRAGVNDFFGCLSSTLAYALQNERDMTGPFSGFILQTASVVEGENDALDEFIVFKA